MDCQQFSPLLQYDFYQDLCKKYPKVFRRHLATNEAGKCLFTTHVGFQEEALANDGGMMLSSSVYEGISNKHSTNWEKEVGHYFQHKSQNSRASGEQVVCSDSFLNSQPLNKHLHEHFPLRRKKRFKEADIQNESELFNGNDHTLENYITEKGKKSVGRNRQERIIQHKIYSAKNSASKSNNEYKSVSPTHNGRHSPPFALLPRLPRSKHTNSGHVDFNTVLADRYLKVHNPRTKMTMNTDSMDLTPDSVIDIDKPSVESLVTTVCNSVKMAGKHAAIPIASEHIGKCMGYDIKSSQGFSIRFSGRNSVMNAAADKGKHAVQYNGNESCTRSSSEILHTSGVHGGGIKSVYSTHYNGIESPQIQHSGSESVHCTLSGNEFIHRTQSGSEYVHSSSTDANDKNDDNNLEKCDNAHHSCLNNDNYKKEIELVNNVFNSSNKNESGLMQLCHVDAESVCMEDLSVKHGCNHNNLIISTISTAMPGCLQTDYSQNFNSCHTGQTDNLPRDSNGHTNMSHYNGVSTSGREGEEIRNHEAEDELKGESLTVMTVAETKHSRQNGTLRDSDVDSGIGIGQSRSDVDNSTPDEFNMEGNPHDCRRRGLNFYNETDDTDIRLGVTAVSDIDKKIAEKYHRAKSPSPYILKNCNRLNSLCQSVTKSAPLIKSHDLDLKAVCISLPDEHFSNSSSTSFTASLQNGNIHRNESLTKITFHPSSSQNVDINSNESSICIKPHFTFSNIVPHSQTCQPNMKSSSSHLEQRKQSLTSSSSADDSVSSLSEMDTLSQAHSITSIDSLNLIKTSTVQYQNKESSTDVLCVDDDGISVEHISGKVTMKTEKFQPTESPSGVKENRLKLEDLLRNKKGCLNPADFETSANTLADGGNELHTIYAKDRRNNKDNLKTSVNIGIVHSEKEPIFSDNNFGSSIEKKCDKPFENESYGLENGQWEGQYINKQFAGQNKEHNMTRFIIRNAKNILGTKETTLTENVIDNKCDHIDSDTLVCNSETLGTDNLDNKAESEIAILKTEPPTKPARTKKTNLCSDLNSSMSSIQTNASDQITLNELFKCRSELDVNHLSEIKLRSNIDEQKKQNAEAISQGNSAYKDRTMLFCATNGFDEIEIMSPHTSSLKKSEVKGMSASKVSLVDSLKSATLGKFKAFRKSMSLEKGIDTCGVEQNPAAVRSKDKRFSGMHKMRKAPSLQSIASYFGRKKKRGKLIFENMDTSSSMGTSLSVSSANFVPLSKDKHQQLPSSQSLSSSTSPAHNHPFGKLLKVNADGTQLIQLYKLQDGLFGFFIAKGNVKYGNSIFISRISPRNPEQHFSGLLGVGDEIMEVNGHSVRDLSKADVHRLITDNPTVVLKVFPFIARNDI